MQTDESKYKQIQANSRNASKYKQLQGNTTQMQLNDSKSKQIHAIQQLLQNESKCKQMQAHASKSKQMEEM